MSEPNDTEELSGLALQMSRMAADAERRQSDLADELQVAQKNFTQATAHIKHLVARIAELEARPTAEAPPSPAGKAGPEPR